MKWLVNTVIEQINFKSEIELLIALQKLRSKGITLRDVFNNLLVDGATDTQSELVGLNSDDEEEIQSLLASLPELLKAAFGRDLSDYPEELKFLGQAFSGLRNTPTECVWHLIESSNDPERKAIKGLLFKLSGSTSAGVRVEAHPALPEFVPESILEPSGLRLAFQGNIHAGIKKSGRDRSVKFELGAKLASTADLSYYFGHSSHTVVANALLTDLRHLVSPFDAKEIYAGIQEGQHLNAIRMIAQGSISFSGNLGFCNATALGKGALVKASSVAQVGFELSESGQFDYLITKAPDSPYLQIRVIRTRESSSQISGGLGVSIDMTQWAERVYPEIKNHLTRASEFLDEVKALQPGSEELRNAFSAALEQAIKKTKLKDEIGHALGFTTGAPIGSIIDDKLLPELETTASIWQENVSRAAGNVVAELFERLNLDTETENILQAELERQLESSFDKLRAKLKTDVTKYVKKSNADKLDKRLKEIGEKFQDGITTVTEKAENLTQIVRDQLDLLQNRLARLKQPFEDASKAKVLFKYEALRRDEDARSLDITFTLDPSHDEASQVLEKILTAELGGYLTTVTSDAIVNISGKYQRYKAIDKKSNFNVVLFGLGFDGSTETKIRSTITVDPQGNIQALTKQEWEKRYGRSVDVRRLTFANAREINASADFTEMTVNFGLTMEDKELQAEELISFLLPFEKKGLLTSGVTSNAVARVDSNLPGHIELGMALTSKQLDHMHQKVEEQEGNEVLRIGAEIFETLTLRNPPNNTFTELLPQFLDDLSDQTNTDLSTISKAIRGWTPEIKKDAQRITAWSSDHGIVDKRLEELITWLDARHTALVGKESYQASWSYEDIVIPGHSEPVLIEARPGIVDLFREIYTIRHRKFDDEVLQNDKKFLNALNDSQMAMNTALRNWHSHGQDVARWWIYQDREPRLYSMALFLLLARLSQGSGSSALPTLSAAITFTNPNGDRTRIPLT